MKALAAACYRLGRLEEAEGALREALDLAAKRPAPEVKLLLAMLYQKSRRPSEARQCYDEAKRWLEDGRLDRGLRAEAEVLRAEAERVLGGR